MLSSWTVVYSCKESNRGVAIESEKVDTANRPPKPSLGSFPNDHHHPLLLALGRGFRLVVLGGRLALGGSGSGTTVHGSVTGRRGSGLGRRGLWHVGAGSAGHGGGYCCWGRSWEIDDNATCRVDGK